jgi:acyl-CoA reductase-like NAD-dependent aldehyde dehydrogenase
MTPGQVVDAISRCRAAARVWALSPFSQRRALMRVLLKHVVDNQETLCR